MAVTAEGSLQYATLECLERQIEAEEDQVTRPSAGHLAWRGDSDQETEAAEPILSVAISNRAVPAELTLSIAAAILP